VFIDCLQELRLTKSHEAMLHLIDESYLVSAADIKIDKMTTILMDMQKKVNIMWEKDIQANKEKEEAIYNDANAKKHNNKQSSRGLTFKMNEVQSAEELSTQQHKEETRRSGFGQ